MRDQPIRVLIVEDDPDYVEIVRLCLAEPESMGLKFELDVACRLAEALQKLSASSYDAVLVDLMLPDAAGLESAIAVLEAAPGTPVLVSTGLGDEDKALEAMRLGVQDFMVKACSDSRLLKRSIRYAIERKAALAERDALLRAAPDGIVVADEDGIVRFANRAAEKALGARAGGLLGRPFPGSSEPGSGRLPPSRKDGGELETRAASVEWNGAPAVMICVRERESPRDAAAKAESLEEASHA